MLSVLAGVIIYSQAEFINDNYEFINNKYLYRDLWRSIRQTILLLNTMVPLSIQFFCDTASTILSKIISKKSNVEINRNGTTAFHYNPTHIVSDKTGTITTGQLDLIKVIINGVDQLSTNKVDNYKVQDILTNLMACSEIQPHSTTKQLLKSDIVEEKLLTQFLSYGFTLDKNSVNNDKRGTGLFVFSDITTNKDHVVTRLLTKPFNYKYGVKISILEDCDKKTTLHVQGTPEAINNYSNNAIDTVLIKIDDEDKPSNVCQRIIAHGSKVLGETEVVKYLDILSDLETNHAEIVESCLKNLETTSVYVFYDYVVEKLNNSISELMESKKDFTLLTGDRMQAAISIAKTIGILDNTIATTTTITIDNDHDLLKTYSNIQNTSTNPAIIINGRALESFIMNSDLKTKLGIIVQKSNKKVIYRASPTTKQLYISFLQHHLKVQTVMVGDGSNDIAALMQSDVGICVKHTDNLHVQHISDILIDNWNCIPKLLNEFNEKRDTLTNIVGWVLTKHMITAFGLLIMLMLTKFEQTKDPASPTLMTLINSSMYIAMCIYCGFENQKENKKEKNILLFTKNYKTTNIELNLLNNSFKGIILGLVNGLVVYNFFENNNISENINDCIILMTYVQVLELLIRLYKYSEKNEPLLLFYFSLICGVWTTSVYYVVKTNIYKYTGLILMSFVLGIFV